MNRETIIKMAREVGFGEMFSTVFCGELERFCALAVAKEREKCVWQPIETAPKDGTNVLVMYMHIDTQIVHNAFYISMEECDEERGIGWWSYDKSEVSRVKLTGWMTPSHWIHKPPDPF